MEILVAKLIFCDQKFFGYQHHPSRTAWRLPNSDSCGRRTRTSDLQLMRLTSWPLLYPASKHRFIVSVHDLRPLCPALISYERHVNSWSTSADATVNSVQLFIYRIGTVMAGPPRFELGTAESKSAELPLLHGPILWCQASPHSERHHSLTCFQKRLTSSDRLITLNPRPLAL